MNLRLWASKAHLGSAFVHGQIWETTQRHGRSEDTGAVSSDERLRVGKRRLGELLRSREEVFCISRLDCIAMHFDFIQLARAREIDPGEPRMHVGKPAILH